MNPERVLSILEKEYGYLGVITPLHLDIVRDVVEIVMKNNNLVYIPCIKKATIIKKLKDGLDEQNWKIIHSPRAKGSWAAAVEPILKYIESKEIIVQ